jgi:2-amino-4-hydroxy-6-hydroxymethyldihydropteridine diphosphokinase
LNTGARRGNRLERHAGIHPIIYLGLGTNLGDRLANLQHAAAALPPQVNVLRVSSIYETEPWGFRDQPAFLNQVLEARTRLAPEALLRYLKQIEQQLGRRPTFRYGPRLVDLDILFYGDQVINLPDLVVPHPHLAERAFMLVPLSELAPTLRHPVSGLTIQEMLAKSDSAGVIKL